MACKLISFVAAAAIVGFPSYGDAHPARSGWTYPRACCQGSEVGGDCERIPGASVRKGPHGFSIILHPGDHHLVTKDHMFQIPYGDEIPSGDSDFHICLHPTEDHMNCFFAPPDGV
ncbi:hypothetical protein PZN02_002632 [Sinorhizobium garamanticum]|uniref:Uncharacterized protein n=1 Tax=Sinorhizobium garamanticum TaxID=680247 RepID=A0ABY8D659_9HYPH|nr:hypothetical protein [Sinorhizobium garamanticum]WEX86354.1 hypothetical protein PZN02_002632 [Sinorhizobium garamanticum]